MDGSTLLQLRTYLRRLLNEPTAAFWSDADLNEYIRRACDKYYSIYQARVPEFGIIEYSVTYTASAKSVKITETDWSFREAISLEDVTSSDPGIPIPIVNSMEFFSRAGSSEMDVTTGYQASQTIAHISHEQSINTGIVSNDLVIRLIPVPGTTLNLKLKIRALPADITGGDSYTCGLPQIFDTPIVLQAAIFAKLQEQNPDTGQLSAELARAEQFLYTQIRPYGREAAVVSFVSDD